MKRSLKNSLYSIGMLSIVAMTGCDSIKDKVISYEKNQEEKLFSQLDEHTNGIRRPIDSNQESAWRLVTKDLNNPEYKGLEDLRVELGIDQHVLSDYYKSRGLPKWSFPKNDDSITSNN